MLIVGDIDAFWQASAVAVAIDVFAAVPTSALLSMLLVALIAVLLPASLSVLYCAVFVRLRAARTCVAERNARCQQEPGASRLHREIRGGPVHLPCRCWRRAQSRKNGRQMAPVDSSQPLHTAHTKTPPSTIGKVDRVSFA